MSITLEELARRVEALEAGQQLLAEMEAFRAETAGKFAEVRTEVADLRTEVRDLRTEMRAGFVAQGTAIREVQQTVTAMARHMGILGEDTQ
jgi:hypothetical protein